MRLIQGMHNLVYYEVGREEREDGIRVEGKLDEIKLFRELWEERKKTLVEASASVLGDSLAGDYIVAKDIKDIKKGNLPFIQVVGVID